MRALSFLVLASTLTPSVLGVPNSDGTVAHVLECVSEVSPLGFQFNIIFSDVQEVSLSSICKNFATDVRSSFGVEINCAAETKGRLVQFGIDLPAKFAGNQVDGYDLLASQFSHTMQGPVTDIQDKDGSRICFNDNFETNIPGASLNNSTDATGQTSKRYVVDSDADLSLRARGLNAREDRTLQPYQQGQATSIAGIRYVVKRLYVHTWLATSQSALFPLVFPTANDVTDESLISVAGKLGSLGRSIGTVVSDFIPNVDLVASFDTGGVDPAANIQPADWLPVIKQLHDTILDGLDGFSNAVVAEFKLDGDVSGHTAIHAQLGWVSSNVLTRTS
ncbi:hypothetical protein LTR97_002517 [Elasticomyces elasticus]|uniref:Uncharacterized protein n=1 Tax=Elasticomyces elasticus TaxID=574655 RepID=A0AAN7ZQ64_9PEZI|nr:hypothetical protein LTR97_002517 [Elasticomyces elasticus]